MSEEKVILGNTPAVVDGAIVAVSQKASTAYVKQVAATKVDKTVYDAKIKEIEDVLKGTDNTTGSIANQIKEAVAVETERATEVEEQLGKDVAAAAAKAAANEAAIGVLNDADTVTGSVKQQIKDAVKAEADLRGEEDEKLAGRLEAVEGAIDVINGTAETAGSINKALADAKGYTDTEIGKVDAKFAGKVDKNGTDRLMTVEEGNKLSALPTNADLTSALGAKANAADVYTKDDTYSKTEVDTELAKKANVADVYTKSDVDGKIASVFKYMGTADSFDTLPADAEVGAVYQVGEEEYVRTNKSTWERLGTAVSLTAYSTTAQMTAAIGTAKTEAITEAGNNADSKISTAIGKLKINDQSFSDNAVTVTGSQIALGDGFSPADKGYLTGLNTNSSVTAAIDLIDQTLTTITGGSNGEGGSIAALQTQINTNISDIDAIETLLPKTAFTSTNTVKDAIDGKVDKVAGKSLVTDTEITKLAAYPAYSVVTDALDDKVDKVAGSSLVANAQITKLEGLKDQATTDAALADKVDKVEGYSLVANAQITKLEALDTKADMDNALAGKVDKNGTDRLMTVDEGNKLAALPTNANLNVLLAAKADKQPVVSDAAQTLEAGKRYVVTDAFAGTLPTDAANGSTVEIFVLVGGTGKTVTAPAGETILGQTLPCAIGISEEGWQLDNESYIFVKNGINWHVL